MNGNPFLCVTLEATAGTAGLILQADTGLLPASPCPSK